MSQELLNVQYMYVCIIIIYMYIHVHVHVCAHTYKTTSFCLSLKRTMDIVVGGKVVGVCGYGEVGREKEKGGKERGREGGREGGREEESREGGRERKREGGREGVVDERGPYITCKCTQLCR